MREPRRKGEENLPALLVRGVLVWRDLEHAWGCIEKNRGNVQFWCQVRAIFVEYVRKVGVRPVPHNLEIAHPVFEGLRKEMAFVRERGFKPQLQWLRLSVSVWSGIRYGCAGNVSFVPDVQHSLCSISFCDGVLGILVRGKVCSGGYIQAHGTSVWWVEADG